MRRLLLAATILFPFAAHGQSANPDQPGTFGGGPYLNANSDLGPLYARPTGSVSAVKIGDLAAASPLPKPQLMKSRLVPATHLKNFLATATPTVCGVGDSTWNFANYTSIGDSTGSRVAQALMSAYPADTITFKDFSFPGRSLSDFTTVVTGASSYPAWYTNQSATWASYVKAAGCTTLVLDFGLNSANYDRVSTYNAFLTQIASWSTVPDVIAISNIEANPNAGAPWNTAPYYQGLLANAALLRTMAESNSTAHVSGAPTIGLIDVGRYFMEAVWGSDPATQAMQRVNATSTPIVSPLAASQTLPTTPGGNFDVTFTVTGTFTSSNPISIGLTDQATEQLLITPTSSTGAGSGTYTQIYDDQALYGVTNGSSWAPGGPNTIEVIAQGADLRLLINGANVWEGLIPRRYAQFAPVITVGGTLPSGSTFSLGNYAVGIPEPYSPIITPAACYGNGSQAGLSAYDGNGANHVSSQCMNWVHKQVIFQALNP